MYFRLQQNLIVEKNVGLCITLKAHFIHRIQIGYFKVGYFKVGYFKTRPNDHRIATHVFESCPQQYFHTDSNAHLHSGQLDKKANLARHRNTRPPTTGHNNKTRDAKQFQNTCLHAQEEVRNN